MINTELITPDIIMDRLDAIPEELRAPLNDPATMAIVVSISKDHHLNDEERILIIQQLVALALMGVIHDYDLAREINLVLDLQNQKLADSIAEAIGAKIFAPIKDILQRNYHPIIAPAPPSSLSRSVTTAPSAPRILEEVKPASFAAKISEPPPAAPPPPAKPITPSTLSFSAKISGVAVPPPITATPPRPAAPLPSSSKLPSFSPASAAAAPKPPTPMPPAPPKPPAPVISQPTPSSPSTSTPSLPPKPAPLPVPPPSSAASGPAPVIIHQESVFKPVQPRADFHLDITSQKPPSGAVSMFGQMQKPTAPPPVTAKVQLGESDTGEKKPVLGKTEIVTPRVVHYTENKSPFGAATVSTPTLSPPPPPTPPNPTPKTLPVAPKPPMPMSDITNGKPPAPSEPASHLPTLPKEVNYTETPKPSAPNPLASPKPPGNLPPSPPPAHA